MMVSCFSSIGYQLTAIGAFAQVYVLQEIQDCRFEIAGGRPGLKVSWQVTGVRHDAWAQQHPLQVTAAGSPVLRVRNGVASGSLIADAVYVYSAALYNDGSAAPSVALAPMDGILLRRTEPAAGPSSRLDRVTDAASYSGAIAPGEWASIFGSGFSSGTQIWSSADSVNGQLPLSLDGVSATIDGQPAYIPVRQRGTDKRAGACRREFRASKR